jgi:hypothetical protein
MPQDEIDAKSRPGVATFQALLRQLPGAPSLDFEI